MARDIKKIINDSLTKPSVDEAVATIFLAEGFAKGSKVAVLDDVVYGFSGLVGTIDGPAENNEGFVNVRFESGTTVPLQVTLLCPV